jgi:hypothetical protein
VGWLVGLCRIFPFVAYPFLIPILLVRVIFSSLLCVCKQSHGLLCIVLLSILSIHTFLQGSFAALLCVSRCSGAAAGRQADEVGYRHGR